MKTYLQKYESPEFHSLNETGYCHQLHVLKVSFWGLIKRKAVIQYEVPYYANLLAYRNHWDYLIKTKTPLR